MAAEHDYAGEKIPADWYWKDEHPFPPGLEVVEVPWPRHAWSDVLTCHGCQRAWLITGRPAEVEPAPQT